MSEAPPKKKCSGCQKRREWLIKQKEKAAERMRLRKERRDARNKI